MKQTTKDVLEVCGWTLLCLVMVMLMVAVMSCATGPDRPPTSGDAKLYDITTTSVEVVTFKTNLITITNMAGQTTGVATIIMPITNYIPSYQYKPGSNAMVIVESTRSVGGLFGWGELAGALVGLGLGVYGTLRSTKNAVQKSSKVADVLAQTIETLRVVLRATPQGARVEDEVVKWMIKNQNVTGVLAEVSAILSRVVDTASAEAASREILAKATAIK